VGSLWAKPEALMPALEGDVIIDSTPPPATLAGTQLDPLRYMSGRNGYYEVSFVECIELLPFHLA